MDNSNKKEFATMFYGIAEEYGGKISKDGIKLKWNALKDYSIDDIRNALSLIIHNRGTTWPPVPTVEEIEKVIKKENGQIDTKTLAGLQCDIVLKYFNSYGSECHHVFKHPTTRYLMENRWSFQILGDMSNKDFAWFQKNFVDAFCELEDVEETVLIGHDPKNKIPADELKRLI